MFSRHGLISILLTASSSPCRAFHTNSIPPMMSRARPELAPWRRNNNMPSSKSNGPIVIAENNKPLLIRGGATTLDAEDGTEGQDVIANRGVLERMKQIFLTQYKPDPNAQSFLTRVEEKKDDGVKVKVAVLGAKESRRFFGVSMARRGLQPCWIEVDNSKGDCALFLDRISLDSNYYPPLEAAMVCHFESLKTILAQGFLSQLLFLPLAILLPLKLVTARGANKEMDEFFCSQSFPQGLVEAGSVERGFVFTPLDVGTKTVTIGLIKPKPALDEKKFVFSVPVPRMARIDHDGREPTIPEDEIVDCSEEVLKTRLELEPRAVSNRGGTKEGDPVNLVVVGDFNTLLAAFATRWDETETTSLQSSIKTVKSFVLGSQYRYSPVSPLFLYGRSQDFALQRARGSINQRLHLRLWMSTMQFEGKPVWVGQVSRDIGVHLAPIFPGTTHKIDPYVDEARDYVVTDLIRCGRVNRFAYVKGVGESSAENPRKNLGGDYYVTNGKRAVLILSPTTTEKPALLDW